MNLCGRPPDVTFHPGEWLPNGRELARYLAHEFDYPDPDLEDLVRIAQWVSVKLENEALYAELHYIFDRDYQPTAIHRTLATLPAFVERQAGSEFPLKYPLMITTNYDDALEKALTEAGVKFDLLTYIAAGKNQGRFLHHSPDSEPTIIPVPKTYDAVSLEERTVVAKIHGAVKRRAPDQDEDSYVVTEDDYIDCLTRTDIVELLPSNVVRRMQHCHYLFLGYSLKDWNLRAILHRIRRDRALGNASWAIQPKPEELEAKVWQKRNVEMFDISLEEFAQAIDGYLGVTDTGGPTPTG